MKIWAFFKLTLFINVNSWWRAAQLLQRQFNISIMLFKKFSLERYFNRAKFFYRGTLREICEQPGTKSDEYGSVWEIWFFRICCFAIDWWLVLKKQIWFLSSCKVFSRQFLPSNLQLRQQSIHCSWLSYGVISDWKSDESCRWVSPGIVHVYHFAHFDSLINYSNL